MIITQDLKGINWRYALCYIDGVLVLNSSFQEHLQNVFDRMKQFDNSNLQSAIWLQRK